MYSLWTKKIRGKIPGDQIAFFNALPDKFTTAEAISMAEKIGIGKRKAERFLEKEERLEKLSHGKYKTKK